MCEDSEQRRRGHPSFVQGQSILLYGQWFMVVSVFVKNYRYYSSILNCRNFLGNCHSILLPRKTRMLLNTTYYFLPYGLLVLHVLIVRH